MKDEFEALANRFLASNSAKATETFNIKNSDDKVIITIVRTKKEDAETVRKGIEKLSERYDSNVSFFGSGTRCPACGR